MPEHPPRPPPQSLRAESLTFLFRADIFVLLSISFGLSPRLTRAQPGRLRLVTESDAVSVGDPGGGGEEAVAEQVQR